MKKLTEEQKKRWEIAKKHPPKVSGIHHGAREKACKWVCDNCGNKVFVRLKHKRICRNCGKINGG